MFDQVCGSDRLRSSMVEDFDFSKLVDFWNKDAESFKLRSSKYYLYK
jgi:hypothetical protein